MTTTTLAKAASPQTEFAVRDWLRTQSSITALMAGDTRKIDLDYSGKGTYLVMYRAGGQPQRNLPIEDTILTFHCYGSTRKVASDLVTALQESLLALGSENLNASVYAYGASVEAVNWLPTSDGTPRYILTANVRARRVATAP